MFDRSHVENILPERLEKYMREFEQDMKFDERNIHEKTLERSSIAAKWCRFSYEEEKYKKKILESVEKLKEQIAEKLYEKKKSEIVSQTIKDNMIKIRSFNKSINNCKRAKKRLMSYIKKINNE